jgi:hypothetical protein
MPLPLGINDIDHAGLLLISFCPFAVEIMQCERDARAERKGLNHDWAA